MMPRIIGTVRNVLRGGGARAKGRKCGKWAADCVGVSSVVVTRGLGFRSCEAKGAIWQGLSMNSYEVIIVCVGVVREDAGGYGLARKGKILLAIPARQADLKTVPMAYILQDWSYAWGWGWGTVE